MRPAPRQHRSVRRAKTGVRPAVRRGRDCPDRQVYRADVANRRNRGGDADPELDIELARLVHRVAIDRCFGHPTECRALVRHRLDPDSA